jgi:ABC-2 type transport system ATP-binding protein
MIEFNHVFKSYGEKIAVEDVSIKVNSGELFGLIGPDGAGKSSLFRMLVTLILPDSGTIFFDGRDVVEDYKYVRSNVGYMPGSFSLYQDLTVEENLNFFAALFDTTVEENYDLIKDIYVQIAPYKTRRAGALSGGMKQKLALCCALIHKPDVLVLDEPTTGVDAVSRKEFWEMLNRLKQGGLTILVSTAYMDEASLCDRVALIQDGVIMALDTPAELIESFDKDLFAVETTNNYQALKRLQNHPDFIQVQPFGDTIHVSLPKGAPEQAISDWLIDEDVEVLQVRRTIPTIEDCFMDLMLTTHE